MFKHTLLFLLIAAGCGDATSDDSDTDTDTDTDTDSDTDTDTDTDTDSDTDTDINPDEMNGIVPDVPAQLPEFSALNHDGSARGPSDLTGTPTVMWFFPYANTYG